MKVHAAVVALILVPSGLLGVSPARAVAAVCQGQPATIEGSNVLITGTEGNDVIVATGPGAGVEALGGNDLICMEGGWVFPGPGDDSVVDTAPAGAGTYAGLYGGNDSYTNVGAGRSDVIVRDVTSVHVSLGAGGGVVELGPTSTPGTGTIDFGAGGYLYVWGEKEARVDLAAQTAGIDGVLTLTTVGRYNATATGCRVRMTGDNGKNTFDAYGADIVVTGGGGRDRLRRVGNGFDVDLPPCHHFKSVFKGQGGPDRLSGRNSDDVLLGGRGYDVAEGSGGNDRCQAEVRRHCER
jgi:Ca2+-binding RTX toxin-like protein